MTNHFAFKFKPSNKIPSISASRNYNFTKTILRPFPAIPPVYPQPNKKSRPPMNSQISRQYATRVNNNDL